MVVSPVHLARGSLAEPKRVSGSWRQYRTYRTNGIRLQDCISDRLHFRRLCRLADVSNAALFRELTADNFAILAEEIGLRLATYQNGNPTTIIGPPTAGTFALAEFWRDALGGEWRCTGAGTPGTWIQIRPAAATADPASGTISTGYLVWNVTDGAVKRHAGAYSWEIGVGANTSAKVGFHGATPTAQRAGAAQAAVAYTSQTISNPPTQAQVQAVNDGLVAAITLLNELRAALVEKGIVKGGA